VIPHIDGMVLAVILMQIFEETLLKHRGGIKLCWYLWSVQTKIILDRLFIIEGDICSVLGTYWYWSAAVANCGVSTRCHWRL